MSESPAFPSVMEEVCTSDGKKFRKQLTNKGWVIWQESKPGFWKVLSPNEVHVLNSYDTLDWYTIETPLITYSGDPYSESGSGVLAIAEGLRPKRIPEC